MRRRRRNEIRPWKAVWRCGRKSRRAGDRSALQGTRSIAALALLPLRRGDRGRPEASIRRDLWPSERPASAAKASSARRQSGEQNPPLPPPSRLAESSHDPHDHDPKARPGDAAGEDSASDRKGRDRLGRELEGLPGGPWTTGTAAEAGTARPGRWMLQRPEQPADCWPEARPATLQGWPRRWARSGRLQRRRPKPAGDCPAFEAEARSSSRTPHRAGPGPAGHGATARAARAGGPAPGSDPSVSVRRPAGRKATRGAPLPSQHGPGPPAVGTTAARAGPARGPRRGLGPRRRCT
jgi:hypothetical protein